MFKTLGFLIGAMAVGAGLLSLAEPSRYSADSPDPAVHSPVEAVRDLVVPARGDWQRVVVHRWSSERARSGGTAGGTDLMESRAGGEYHFAIHSNGSVLAGAPWREQVAIGKGSDDLHVRLSAARPDNPITRVQRRAFEELVDLLRRECLLELARIDVTEPAEDTRFAVLMGHASGFRDLLMSVGLTRRIPIHD